MTVDLDDELRALAIATARDVEDLPWAFEADRWAELVFCLLSTYGDDDSARARQVTSALAGAGLCDPEALARLADTSGDAHAAARHVLAHHGIADDDARDLMAVLARMGAAVTDTFGGKLQLYLRAKATQIRDELAGMFGDDPAGPDPRLRQGVSLWLQNALNLPLSVENRHVRRFCERHGIRLADLEEAADRLGINMAVVDDLVRSADATDGDPDPDPDPRGPAPAAPG